MNLDFDTEQHQFRESVRGTLVRLKGDYEPPAELVADAEPIMPAWPDVAATGWLDLSTAVLDPDNSHLLALLALHMELGRGLAVGPYVEAAVAATVAGMLDRSPSLADDIAGGTRIVPIVLGTVRPTGDLSLKSLADTSILSGREFLVGYADSAEHFLIVDLPEQDRCQVALIDARRPGLSTELHTNTANLPLASLVANEVIVAEADHLGSISVNARQRVEQLAVLLEIGQIIGIGEQLLELCTSYATARRQFGRQIGQFQAVQYLCTDIAIATHETFLLAISAARSFSDDPTERVGLAASRALVAAKRIAVCAHEVFAGAAFMMESDVQRYSRRLKHLELRLREFDAESSVLQPAAAGADL